MTDPRFDRAVITDEGLDTTWTDVPADGEQERLLLALLVQRDDGSEVRFGARWSPDDATSPVVFAYDTRAVEERIHEAPETAIARAGGEVRVVFPRTWIDALIDAGELHGAAVVTVDDVDRSATPVDLDPAA